MKTTVALVVAVCGGIAAGQGTGPPAASGNTYRMKVARIVDERGFERAMTALTMLIPADWQFQGKAQYAATPGCHANLVRLVFRATSPDGRLAMELFPGNVWQWADDRNAVGLMQASNQQLAQFGGRGCDLIPPLTAEEFLRRAVLPGMRREARVQGVEPIPDVAEQAQEQARQMEQAATRQGVPMRLRVDVTRLRLSYHLGGQAMEEWMTAMTYASGIPGPTFNMMTGQMGQALYYTCGGDHVMGLRAPQGQLDGQEKFFRMVLSTIRVDPQWAARVAESIANLQATDLKGARDRSAIATQSARDIGNIIRETHANTNQGRDRAMEGWSQYMRGVETFRNPATGESVDLSNQYGHAWAGANGEYIVSDSTSFDPNVSVRGNWTRLEPVRR